jgi:hypothetical protein
MFYSSQKASSQDKRSRTCSGPFFWYSLHCRVCHRHIIRSPLRFLPKCHRRKSSDVMMPGRGARQCAEVRAAVVYFETGRGGAVFSVGSIDWTSALSENSFEMI